MSDRDRLIELILHTPQKQAVIQGRATGKTYRTAENIADHLIANGVIVPPCKVGDTVYVISQGQGFNCRWGVYEGKVTDIHIDKYNKITIRAENGEKFFGYYEPKFVFLSREEAERALEEVQQCSTT